MTLVSTIIISVAPFLLLLVGLGFSVITNRYISTQQKKLMLLLLFFTISLIAQNVGDYLMKNSEATWFLKTLCSVYGYTVRPVILSIFCVIISGGKKSIPAWVLTGVNAAIYLTAFEPIHPISFAFDKNLVFFRGPLGYSCHIISAGLMLYLLVITLMKVKANKKEMIIPIVSTLLIAGATVFDTFASVVDDFVLSTLTIAIVLSCNFYYYWLHIMFVQEYEITDILEQQRGTLRIVPEKIDCDV